MAKDKAELAIMFGINTQNGPARQEFVTNQARLKTYTAWPLSTGQLPKVMSEAGFFYLGSSDHVKCFYCVVGLKNWEVGDDPWFEHARWNPKCPFVLLNKGQIINRAAKLRSPCSPVSFLYTNPNKILPSIQKIAVFKINYF